jgi:two-component system phosphate regulon sensor histidine kinase PhoR
LVREPRFVQFMEGRGFDGGLEIVHEDTPLSIRVVPYGDSGKKLLLLRDMTRMLKLERMRRDFVANVSHEMKSPLTVIKGYVESLLDTAEKEGLRTEKPLRQIDMQTDRMCHIVEDLLQLSSLEMDEAANKLTVVDAPNMIRSVCSEAREVSSGGHELTVEIDDQLMIMGSYNELYSAFSNIVLNAITYTPDGGTIGITWRLDESGSPVFSVQDTGVGISPEHIPRLTERFYRVDQARSRELGGTGLGLAIVKHIMLRHNAELRIRSRLNHGSIFSCIFPKSSACARDQKASNA